MRSIQMTPLTPNITQENNMNKKTRAEFVKELGRLLQSDHICKTLKSVAPKSFLSTDSELDFNVKLMDFIRDYQPKE